MTVGHLEVVRRFRHVNAGLVLRQLHPANHLAAHLAFVSVDNDLIQGCAGLAQTELDTGNVVVHRIAQARYPESFTRQGALET